MTQFIIITLNGLTLAALYFLVASGFSLIFGLLRTVNMAHGSLYLLGAYLSYSIWNATGENWIVALVAAPLITAVFGILMQQFFLRRIAGQDLREALVTIAISIIIADLLLARYGGQNYLVNPPQFLLGATRIEIGNFFIVYPTFRLFTLGSAIFVGIVLWYIVQRTRLGIVIRAGIDDDQMVGVLGYDINRLFMVVFGIGAFLAGLAGMYGITTLSVSPGDDGTYLLASLIVVIVGGMGSLGGAALGAVLVGLAQQYGLAYVPTYASLITFAIMTLVLAVRPQGLLRS